MDPKQSGSKLNHDTTPIVTKPAPDPKAEEFRKFIEVEVLKIIKQLAEKGETSQDAIAAIARDVLELIKPGMSLERLYQNVVKLDNLHSQLAPVVSKAIGEYEQKYEKKAITMVSQLVKNGKYDQAQELVKKVLQFKISN